MSRDRRVINMRMKTLLKLAMMVGCATLLPLLSARAATVQVQVGADGLEFTPAGCDNRGRRYGAVGLGGQRRWQDFRDAGTAERALGFGGAEYRVCF